jgi:hypothetical protein
MRPSQEALFIGALINNHDASLGATYGVEPEMLVGYQPEYRWVLSYLATYGGTPTWDAFLHKFPEFPKTDATDAAFAADEVRYTFAQRSMRQAIRSAASHISEGDYEEAAMALASYTPLAQVKPAINALHDLSFLDAYSEKPDALEVPWPTLQRLTGGIREGDLWYLAARLGNGKSWNVTDLAATALMAGRSVNFFTLEMPKAQVLVRMHVCLGQQLGFDVDHIAMRDRVYDVIAYRKLVNKIRDEVPGQLFIYDPSDGRVSPATVAAKVGKTDLSIVDYVGLMASPLGKKAIDDWRVQAAISNELKEVALAKQTRIVALSQINREGDTISKYPPKAKNLSGSDALGQDADVIVTHKKYSHTSQIASLEKNRHGEADRYFYTRFLPNEGRFHEISRDTADDLRDREQDD